LKREKKKRKENFSFLLVNLIYQDGERARRESKSERVKVKE